jgi:hypothetical protein
MTQSDARPGQDHPGPRSNEAGCHAEPDDAVAAVAATLAAAYAELPPPERGPVQIVIAADSGSVTVSGADWSVTFHDGLAGPVEVELPRGQPDVTMALTGDDVEPLAVADAQLGGALVAALVRSGSTGAQSLADAIEYIQAKAPRRHRAV